METVIQPTTCINANQKVYGFCLPKRIECIKQPKTGRFVDCDKKWNCNIPCQQDRQYNIPFVKGDLIQFQTLFFTGTPSNPTPYDDAISITICANDNEGQYSIVGKKMSAWKDGLPYQIIEVDTTDLPDCFSLEFTNLETDEKCCTQEFGVKDDCQGAILIQSKRTTSDCFGYRYGSPDSFIGDELEYNNSLRYCGWIKDTGWGNEIERLETSSNIKSEVVKDNFLLTFNGKMPKFAANILCNQLLTGGEVCIDGVDYSYDSFSINNELTTGTMYKFSIELHNYCVSSSTNCS